MNLPKSLALASFLALPTHAATVIPDYENPGPDGESFLYISKVIMSTTDSWDGTASPGAWSFRNNNPGSDPNAGWGHASRWFLLELTGAATLSVSMTSATDGAWAGFAIYSGESVNDDPAEAHTYSNNGLNLEGLNNWDLNGPGGTRGLGFVGSSSAAVPTPGASGTWTLPAGLYTIVFGNIGDSSLAGGAKNYSLNLTTIPEPSAAALALLGFAAALRRRRA